MLRRSERVVMNKSKADWVPVVVQNTSSGLNDSQKLTSQQEAGTESDIDDFDHDYDTFEDEDPEVDESDKEDSDYSLKMPAQTPLKKRAKMATSSSSMAKSNGKQKKSLSLLPSMPLDILFEIFSRLRPEDLINLARTSKTLRETLMTRNAITVWKATRERVGIPECPSWISEPAWAVLLFGNVCQSCGAKNIQKVDFLLMRRVCVRCKKAHLVYRGKFFKQYPEADAEVLDLVPATNVGGWAHGHPSSSFFYWDSDLSGLIHQLSVLEKDVQMRRPDARNILIEYKEDRKQRIKQMKEKSNQWEDRMTVMQFKHLQEKEGAQTRRADEIRARFKLLGYAEQDLSFDNFHRECRNKAQLTDRVWERIRQQLEPDAMKHKRNRLERESANTLWSRRKIVDIRYKAYRRTFPPSQWKYLPRTLDITRFEPFAQHVEADPMVEVTTEMFDEAFERLPELLAAAAEERKICLCSLLPTVTADSAAEEGEIQDAPPSPVELATAVFRCTHSHLFPFLFGWDDVASHHCPSEREGLEWHFPSVTAGSEPLKYCPQLIRVVEKVVHLAGIDPKISTAADLDARDLRFSCGSCAVVKESGQHYCLGYDWRNLVNHLGLNETHNPGLIITVLSNQEAAEVRICEHGDGKWTARLWTCAQCPQHLENLQTRQTVVEHLRHSHAIMTPVDPNDLFFFERKRSGFTCRPKFSVPAPQKDLSSSYRCLLCTQKKEMAREFMHNGVRDHLRAKHDIRDPMPGIHYAQPDAVGPAK